MAGWLLKTEPGEYAWADLVREGRTTWTGVRNPQALRHLGAMRPGELAFVYHTGNEKQVVGIAEVVSEPYLGPDGATVVDLAPRAALARPVALATLRGEPIFADHPLVRQPRLSVMPVDHVAWARVLALGSGPA